MPVAGSSRFLELKERVQRLRGDNTIADRQANDELDRIAAQAACAYGECAYSDKPGFDRQFFNPRPDCPLSKRTDFWALQWRAIIGGLSFLHPADIPSDPGAPRMVTHSVYARSGIFYQSDWRLRAEHFVTALTLLARMAGEGATPGAAAGGTAVEKKKRGRRVDTDPAADKRVYDAWKSGSHRTYADLANTLKKTEREVGLAIDRHEKRLTKKRCQAV